MFLTSKIATKRRKLTKEGDELELEINEIDYPRTRRSTVTTKICRQGDHIKLLIQGIHISSCFYSFML